MAAVVVGAIYQHATDTHIANFTSRLPKRIIAAVNLIQLTAASKNIKIFQNGSLAHDNL